MYSRTAGADMQMRMRQNPTECRARLDSVGNLGKTNRTIPIRVSGTAHHDSFGYGTTRSTRYRIRLRPIQSVGRESPTDLGHRRRPTVRSRTDRPTGMHVATFTKEKSDRHARSSLVTLNRQLMRCEHRRNELDAVHHTQA